MSTEYETNQPSDRADGRARAGGTGDALGLTGEVTLRHIRDGKVISETTERNMVVNAGLEHFARLLIQGKDDPNRGLGAFYIQIGTGGLGPDPKDPNVTVVVPASPTDTALRVYFSQSGTKINVPGDGGEDDEAPRRLRIVPERGKIGDPGYVPFKAVAQVAYTFDFNHVASVKISETGLFTGPYRSSSCVMLAHRTFAELTFIQSDFLEVVWEIGFSRR